MYKYLVLVFILIFTGCSYSSNSLDKNMQEESITTKRYVNISKDSIFEAAKKVFILAGEKEFRIDSYRDKLVVSRTKLNHYLFIPTTHDDFWVLSISEDKNITNAKLELYRVTNFDEENIEYIDKSIHSLLWSRIDYLLGLSDEWTSCKNYWDFSDALCDSIDMNYYKEAKKDDIVKDILIVDRKRSQSVNEIDVDILENDIELSVDNSEEDILENEDNIEESNLAEDTLNNSIDKEIEELDKRVNENIDNTLDKIKEEIVDEIESDK